MKTRLKQKRGFLAATLIALALSLPISAASPSYHLMEIRQDHTAKSVTLTSKIPRLSGLSDETEQAKRNVEFLEDSKKALVQAQVFCAKSGADTANAIQSYQVSYADETTLSIVLQTDFSAAGTQASLKQGHTIRLSDAKPLAFNDLFEADSNYQQAIVKLINQQFPDLDYYPNPRQPYYLTEDSVVLLIGSASSFSQQEIPLAKSELQDYFKQEW